jgi:hypothetical protein
MSREPGKSAAVTPVPALAPSPPCEARMDLPAGLHDRYLFRDEAAELVGYKDKAGAVVIPPVLHDGYAFTPGGLAAVIDGKTPFVFIDTTGKVVFKAFAYDNGPDYYQEGFARIVGPDGKIGFIGETSGRLEIPATLDKATPFCHGKAHVLVGGQEYDIDPRGQRIRP